MDTDAPDYYLFSHLPVPCVLLELASGKIVDANSSFKKEFVPSDINPIGKTTLELKMWEDSSKRQELLNTLAKNGKIEEAQCSLKNKHGETNTYIINSTAINGAYYMATIVNVSEIENQKTKYKQLLEKYQSMIRMTGSAFVILDDKFIIQETNEVMGVIMGTSEMELIGEKFVKIICDDAKKIREQLIIQFEGMLVEENHNKVLTMDICIKKKDGNKVWMALNAGCLTASKIVCFLHDISKKKTEEHSKFINSEKNKDKIKQKLNKFQRELNVLANRNG